ncbi:MAG TPA: PKD domain-containing protein [Polyangia bacterium]|nr:PKD domain-containing protein [Polyangia bacterium]
MLRRAAAISTLLVVGLACSSHSVQFVDGGLDAGTSDGAVGDGPAPLALDLAVTGCASYSVGQARCTGGPPLTLSFSPVGSPSLTRFLWTFGDGTPGSTDRAPTHTYTLPGLYDVSVVADGPAGSVSRMRAMLVQVTTLATGAPCDVDAQCAAGVSCRCASGSCGAAFARGVCTRACPSTGCGAGAACAAFSFPTPGTGGSADAGASDAAQVSDGATSDARDAAADHAPTDAATTPDAATGDALPDTLALEDGPSAGGDASSADAAAVTSGGVCLGACTADADCPAGLGCRSVPAPAGAAARWARVCLPPAYQEIGAPCRDETGALDGDGCASGTCADLGALGACAASCDGGAPCPTGSACATFGDGRALCVATCSTTVTCARDPLLRCQAAGALGALGFHVTSATTGATYCAPRTCTGASDCGPAGACTPPGVGAHCTRL